MTILRSTKDNAVFISNPTTQGIKELSWVSCTPSYTSISEKFNVDSSSTSTQLNSITRDGAVLQQGDAIIAKTPSYSEVYKGTAGFTTSNVQSTNNITGSVYDGINFSTSSQGVFSPNFVLFNDTGSKMYAGGSSSDGIYQYTLTTPFDISTVSYDNVFFSFRTQEFTVASAKFNNDGTRLFMIGRSQDTIFQYDLSTPYDIGTVSYSGNFFDLDAQEFGPYSITFNNNGTKFYMVGSTNDTIFEYTLSAFDITTLSYTGNSFDFSSQATVPKAIEFTNNGSKLFVTNQDNQTIYEYDLSTPYDVTTISYNGLSFAINGTEFLLNNPEDITFNNDATKFFIAGSSNSRIYQFSKEDFDVTVTTADISDLGLAEAPTLVARDSLPTMSVSFEPFADRCLTKDVSLDLTSSTTTQFVGQRAAGEPSDLIRLNAGDLVIPYNNGSADSPIRLTADAVVSSGEGITSVDFDSLEILDITNTAEFARDINFDDTGTKLIILDGSSNSLWEYTLTTPYDITTAGSPTNGTTLSGISRPQGFQFSNNGTELFVYGDLNDRLLRYSLTIPYDTSTGNTQPQDSVDVSSFAPFGNGIAASNDGTVILFIDGDQTISEATMSTPWDITTLVFNNVTVDLTRLGLPDPNYTSLRFNNDGTLLYLLDENTPAVYRLSLSTPYDITTASNDNLYMNLGQLSQPQGFAISPDESRIFVVGYNGDYVAQYDVLGPPLYSLEFPALAYSPSRVVVPSRATDLTTPTSEEWVLDPENGNDDVVSRSYAKIEDQWAKAVQYQVNFSANSDVRSINFDFEKEPAQDFVLPKLWDIGSIGRVAGNEITASIGTGGDGQKGIALKPDGTEIYFVGFDSSTFEAVVSQITLSTEYDFTSNTGEKFLNLAPLVDYPTDIEFKTDGTRMFIQDDDFPTRLYRYDLSTPWDVTTASYVGPGEFDIRSQELSPYSIEFNNTGSKMYITGTGDVVYQYSLSTPFNVSTASVETSFSVAAQESNTRSVTFNDTGSKMYITGSGTDFLYQYTLSTPFDISTASYDNVSVDLDNQDFNPHAIQFNNDGTKFFMIGLYVDNINEYTLSTPYDISTLSFTFSNDAFAEDGTPYDFTFNNDGSKLYVVGGNTDTIYQYSFTTPYDISAGVTYDGVSFDVSGFESTTTAIRFNNDGTQLYFVGTNNDTVYQLEVPVAFDLSSIAPVVGETGEIFAPAIFYDITGNKLFALSTSTVYAYDTQSAWDLEGVARRTGSDENFSIDDSGVAARHLAFKPDGTEMYISTVFNDAENYIFQYTLATPWDITTAVFKQQYEDKDALNTTGLMNGFYINPNTGREVVIRSGNTAYLFEIEQNLLPDDPIIIGDVDWTGDIFSNTGWDLIS